MSLLNPMSGLPFVAVVSALIHPRSPWQSTDTLLLVVVFILVALSGFLAFSETALTRMSRIKAAALVEQRARGSKKLAALLERPAAFLNPLLLVTLITQLVAATLVGVIADHVYGGIGVTVATVAEVLVIFLFGEAIPKNSAVKNPEKAALLAAPFVGVLIRLWPLRAASRLVGGLARLLIRGEAEMLGRVSEEELLAMADAAMEGEVIETGERALIHSIISFGDTVAREVMVPRPDMVAVGAERLVDEVIDIVLEVGFSRIPVFEDGIDNVVGIILAKDLLGAEKNGKGSMQLRSLIRPAHFVPETKAVAELLKEMQGGKFHIAIVVDEYGSTAGLVTLEDLIEELVGDITDEFDKEVPLVKVVEGGSYDLSGSMPIGDLEELLGVELPEGDWDTVGGFVLGLLGHLPEEGEIVRTVGYSFMAMSVIGRRLAVVRVAPRPDGSDDEDE